MDHKVSKDMISSGMIPSGEKTQADLGRTQYGSAPSPNKLMDAYKSMYKEENGKQGPSSSLSDVPRMSDSQRRAFAKRDQADDDMIRARQQDKIETAKNSPQAQKIKSDKIKKAREAFRTGQRQENIDLLAAYRAVYEHHQKDKDGNTIPHEGEEVKEENINELKTRTMLNYIDKASDSASKELDKAEKTTSRKKEVKARLKMDKRERGIEMAKDKIMKRVKKEDADLFDVISTHFINEGYEEKDVYKAMASLTGDQLQNLDEALPAVGAVLAAIPAIAGKLATGAAVAGKTAVAAGAKGLMAAGKAGLGAAKGAMKGVVSASKPVTQGISKVASKATTGVKDMVGKGTTQIKKVVNPQPANKQLSLDLGKAGKSSPTSKSPDEALNKIKDFARGEIRNKARQEILKDREVQGTNKTAMASASKATLGASADLFDIVKGKLLDEGLSEEEIKDIMLTLTPDEIMEELSDNIKSIDAANKAKFEGSASEKVKAASRRQMKAGTAAEDPKNPYTTADKKTIIDANKKPVERRGGRTDGTAGSYREKPSM